MIENTDFDGVCNDYELAAATLAQLLETPGSEAAVADYRELVAELEREIEGRLADARRDV